MKTIVTHIYPDLDATTSTWLVKRFIPGWDEAGITFVSAGCTFRDLPPDGDENIIHVDTGLGKFDHHQSNEYTSATKKVYEYLVEESLLDSDIIEPLEKLVHHVNDIDHFAEVSFPDPTNDRYEFSLSQIIDGLNNTLHDNSRVVETVFVILDAILQLFVNKVKAIEEIKKGFILETKWGKTLAMESKNEEAMKLALKSGYCLVIRKDPVKGNLRVKTTPGAQYSLSELHEKLKKADPNATWYLHSSKNILLNGSSKGPNMVPTELPLKTVIEIIKKIK